MPLWLFETDTLLSMRRDCMKVAAGVSRDANSNAVKTLNLIEAELTIRNVKWEN